MHRVMRGVRDPGLLVDHRQPPAGVIGAGEMIEPRHRAIVDIEGKAFLRLTAERKADGSPDRAAMRDDDDVPARPLGVDALDGTACAVIEVHETLPAGRRFVDFGKPVAADGAAGKERCDSGLATHRDAVRRTRSHAAYLTAWESPRPRSRLRSDACASDCLHTRPRCAAGFFRPPRTRYGRWCRSRDPSARRC